MNRMARQPHYPHCSEHVDNKTVTWPQKTPPLWDTLFKVTDRLPVNLISFLKSFSSLLIDVFIYLVPIFQSFVAPVLISFKFLALYKDGSKARLFILSWEGVKSERSFYRDRI